MKTHVTHNGKRYTVEMHISPYFRYHRGNGDPLTLYLRDSHEHNLRIHLQCGEEHRHLDCRVIYYLKDGKPNHRSCRYVYAGIVEARIQKFLKKIL